MCFGLNHLFLLSLWNDTDILTVRQKIPTRLFFFFFYYYHYYFLKLWLLAACKFAGMTLVKLFSFGIYRASVFCLCPGSLHRLPAEKSRIITVYSFFFYSHAITCSFDTPSQKYAILSLSWLYAVTGIICTATFLFLKFEFTM